MAEINAVIFDRDGVLADFDWAGARSAFKTLPIPLAELAQRRQIWGEVHGNPADLEQEQDFFKTFWDNLGQEFQIPEQDMKKFRAFDYVKYLVLYPDASAALAWLKINGIKVGVLTNSGLASVDKTIAALGIGAYVDVACSSSVIGVAKPDPKAYSIVMEQLGFGPEQILFFDDKPRHIDGARNAGIANAFWVDRSIPEHDLPNHKVKDLTAIKRIIEGVK